MFRTLTKSIIALLCLFLGVMTVPATAGAAPASSSSTPVGGMDAKEALDVLMIHPRDSKKGYTRKQFGKSWDDVDKNSCDTRNDILDRDLEEKTYLDSQSCKVASGVLYDPYAGKRIDFVRGPKTSAAVQIEHVVALSNAWQTGAQYLTAEQRLQFANDPYNLIASDGPTNANKGDSDISEWVPPNTHYVCEYAARQVGVKAKYGLWITQAEHDRFAQIFDTCPGQTIPVRDGISESETQYIKSRTGAARGSSSGTGESFFRSGASSNTNASGTATANTQSGTR